MTDTIDAKPSARYLVAEVDGRKTVTAYLNGTPLATDSETNPNFDTIVARLFEGDTDGIEALFNAEYEVQRKFKKVSERVSVSGGRVFFDNDPIENTLSDHLLRLIKNGDDVVHLINFWEQIAANPATHARESLLAWLATHDFTITPSGHIIGYKGLNADGTSITAGPGIVNGQEMNGNLPNDEGNIMEIARSKVVEDRAIGCASGLHVGTFDYAKDFARGRLVEAIFSPRDVVSVPTDCGAAKVRVCRYVVGKTIDTKRDEAVVSDYEAKPVEDDDFASSDAGSDWVI